MNNINITKEEGVKTIRKLYSAVNELLDILGRDVSEGGYDKEKLERKVQAYVNYLGDTKEWEELAKRKDNNEDKDLLLDKVQDDVLDIMSLSTSREDADKARKALRQLSVVTSADVMDVLNSCIDDGGKIGKSTRYAKKKLVMNSVPSIYEKEETNNGADLYYNVVHGRYQILNGDKIYTTKRGGVPKTQETDSQENGEEGVGVSETGQIDENIDETPVNLDVVEEEPNHVVVVEEVVEGQEEIVEQSEKVDTIKEQSSGENAESEEKVEWSEEKVLKELEKLHNIEEFKELQRCNDVEISFLAREISKSPKTIDLLRKISLSEGDEGNNEKINSEFKSILDKLFVNFTVNTKYFEETDVIKELTGDEVSFEVIKSNLGDVLGLGAGSEVLSDFKTISEYMSFISFMNNIKNSVVEASREIRLERKRAKLVDLLNLDKNNAEIEEVIKDCLFKLVMKEIKAYEKLKSGDNKNSSKEMNYKLEQEIESEFDNLIYKRKTGKGFSLRDRVKKEIYEFVKKNKNNENIDISGLMNLFLPLFIKMGIYGKPNNVLAHKWFEHVDVTSSASTIKYVNNGNTIELSIPKLKDFVLDASNLKSDYYNFKNMVLQAVFKTIKENTDCIYGIELEKKGSKYDKPSLVVYDSLTRGGQFFEDSHYGDCLRGVFNREARIVINTNIESGSGDTDESIIVQGESEVEDGDEVIGAHEWGGESTEITEVSPASATEATEERINENKVEGPKKGTNRKKQDKVSEGNDGVNNITVEDIINFYVNNDERVKLKSLKKAGGSDQRDCPKLREDYKIRIIKPGFKKGILIGLKTIADKIGERTGNKINKPYTHKGFDTIVGELARLGGKS